MTDAFETRRGLPPAAGLIAAVAIALVGVLAGLAAGEGVSDVDQAVYQDTLRQMRDGEGYYEAHRDALVTKEGSAPSSIRAIRPPTLFLLLRWFPESSWRYLVGLAYLGLLLGAWRLGEPYAPYGGIIAVVLAGLWVIAASSFLFLHAELWGAPFLLWGAVEVRRGRDGSAAVLIACATVIRELYGLALLIGLIIRKARAPWLAATTLAGMLAIVHAVLARGVLSASGGQVALGNEPYTASPILTILSPGDTIASWTVGMAMVAAGSIGIIRARREDPAAAFLLPFVAIMIPASVIATRSYWSLTWGPAIAVFAMRGIPPGGPRQRRAARPGPSPDRAS